MNLEDTVKKFGDSIKKEIVTIEEYSPEIQQILSAIEKRTPINVSISKISTNENIRKKIDKNSHEFQQLVESVKKYGILQSVVLEFRQIDHSKYELICVAGHRRIEAVKHLDLDIKIPSLLIKVDRKGATAGVALSENINRKNLHFIEVADTYHTLKHSEGMPEEEISKIFDRNLRTVSTYLKMAMWPSEAKNLILDNTDVFPLRYIWDNFAKKTVSDGQLLRQLKVRLKKYRQADSKENVKKTSQSSKSKRATNLKKYFSEKGTSKNIQKEITDALLYLKLL